MLGFLGLRPSVLPGFVADSKKYVYICLFLDYFDGCEVFGLEFDLFWYKDGILIDVCFGEPPWRFDGLSLTLRLFRDTLIIVPEDLG